MYPSNDVFTANSENLGFPANRLERIAAIRKATVRLALIELAIAVSFSVIAAIVSFLRIGSVGDGFSTFVGLCLVFSVLAELTLFIPN